MSWSDALESVNYMAVVAGTLVSMVFGMTWYAQRMFGKHWAKLIGFKKKYIEDKNGMPVMMTMSIVFYFIVSLIIAALFAMIGGANTADGALLGAILGFAFGFGPISVTYVYARRTFDLSLIDGGFIFVTCAAIGAVIGYVG